MSSLINLSGVNVIAGAISVPYSGPWHADLVLSDPTDVSGQQTLAFFGVNWTCSYVRDISFAGRRGVRLVSGSGGWRKTLPAKQYGAGVIATSTVASDAALAVGEPRPVVDSSAPQTVGAAFCRSAGLASQVLQQLFGSAWYVDTSGVVQTAPRAGSVSTYFAAIESDLSAGSLLLGTDSPNDWLPGKTFSCPTIAGTVNRVMHYVSNEIRTEAMFS